MFTRSIRSLRHVPAASMADIAFILLVFFMVSVQFRADSPQPMIIADPDIISRSSESNHRVQCGPDGTVSYIQHGDTIHLSMVALADSALQWARRTPRAIVIVRSYPDIPSHGPLAVVSLLREAGINGVILGELEPSDR